MEKHCSKTSSPLIPVVLEKKRISEEERNALNEKIKHLLKEMDARLDSGGYNEDSPEIVQIEKELELLEAHLSKMEGA